ACIKMKNVQVIYTAHGFHFYKGASLKNWLVFYPIEKILSIFTDILITINQEDYKLAQKKFFAKNVEYITGVGLDIAKYENTIVNKSCKRQELNIPVESFLILSVGELNKNKNHETIIRSIAKLSDLNVHYVICGQGPLKNYL